MEAIFKSCAYSQVRTGEFFTLVQKILEAAEKMLTDPTALTIIEPYKAAVTAFDEAMRQNTTNSYTVSAELADQAVDEMWSAIWTLLKAMVKHPNLNRRKAAASLYDLFRKYGNVTMMGNAEEYAQLHNLTQEIEALGSETIELAHFEEWFQEFKERIATYKSVEASRTAEEGSRQIGIVKQTRTAAEEALRVFLRKVEALVLINGEEGYTDFINSVNALISAQVALMKSRKTQAAKNKEEEGETGQTSQSTNANLPQRDPDPEIAPGLNEEDEDDGSGSPSGI